MFFNGQKTKGCRIYILEWLDRSFKWRLHTVTGVFKRYINLRAKPEGRCIASTLRSPTVWILRQIWTPSPISLQVWTHIYLQIWKRSPVFKKVTMYLVMKSKYKISFSNGNRQHLKMTRTKLFNNSLRSAGNQKSNCQGEKNWSQDPTHSFGEVRQSWMTTAKTQSKWCL